MAAVLFADVVGFSRLMALDEAGTAAAVTEYQLRARDEVEAQGGRVVKTAGDGTMATFDSTVAAVRAACLLQRNLQGEVIEAPDGAPVAVRIGIHVGDVLIDGDDLLGEAVNLAARLETASPVGGVTVSRTVYEQVRGRVDETLERLGTREFKNIPEPIEVFAWHPEGIVPDAPPGQVSGATIAKGMLPAAALVTLLSLFVYNWALRTDMSVTEKPGGTLVVPKTSAEPAPPPVESAPPKTVEVEPPLPTWDGRAPIEVEGLAKLDGDGAEAFTQATEMARESALSTALRIAVAAVLGSAEAATAATPQLAPPGQHADGVEVIERTRNDGQVRVKSAVRFDRAHLESALVRVGVTLPGVTPRLFVFGEEESCARSMADRLRVAGLESHDSSTLSPEKLSAVRDKLGGGAEARVEAARLASADMLLRVRCAALGARSEAFNGDTGRLLHAAIDLPAKGSLSELGAELELAWQRYLLGPRSVHLEIVDGATHRRIANLRRTLTNDVPAILSVRVRRANYRESRATLNVYLEGAMDRAVDALLEATKEELELEVLELAPEQLTLSLRGAGPAPAR